MFSVIGQPIALSNTTRSQSQAGFMQAVDYIIVDAVAPVITFAGGSQKINKQSPPIITATIDDNIAVATAKFNYRKITDATWATFDMAAGANKTFSSTILPTWFDAMGMEYFLEATDAAGNKDREPATGSFFAYLSSSEETIPSERIGFASKPSKDTDYKIVSVPFTTANNSVTSLFDELGAYSNTKWRMATYNNPTDKFFEYPADFSSIAPGVGYWILVKNPVDIKLGPVDAPAHHRGALYAMTLKPGWNMVGNPYPVSIDWGDVLTLNNNANVGEIKVYNAGFSNGTVIAPYQGGFVFVNGAADAVVKIPFEGQIAEGGRTSDNFGQDIAADAWRIDLELSQHGAKNNLPGFGMHREASNESDRYDDYNPPAFLNGPQVNFPHPEHRLANFCRDIIPLAPEATWPFTLHGEVGNEITLRWHPDFGNNGLDLLLVDEVNLNVIDLREVDSYTFTLLQDHAFKIYFGKDAREKVRPKSIAINAPFPNPVSRNNSLYFKVALPDQSAPYSIESSIISSEGVTVSTTAGEFSPGIHEVAVEIGNHQILGGLHYYRIVVRSPVGKKVFTGKLIVL